MEQKAYELHYDGKVHDIPVVTGISENEDAYTDLISKLRFGQSGLITFRLRGFH